MMKCPACGHDNVNGTTFCEMCGEELTATASGASTPAPAAGEDIKCPACENMNPPENVVCEVCGTELRAPDDSDVSSLADTSADTSTTDTAAASPADDSAASTPVVDAPPADAPPADAPTVTTPATTAVQDIPAAPTTDTSDSDTADSTTIAPSAATVPSAPLAPGSVKLVVEQGMTVGKQFVLGDAELQVGREDEEEDIYPDIDLADQDEGYVHRRHATLKFENDQLFVTHLGGANKTRVNNKPIPDNAPHPIKLGDKIAFGKVVLRLLPL